MNGALKYYIVRITFICVLFWPLLLVTSCFSAITTIHLATDAEYNQIIKNLAFVPEGRFGNNNASTGDFELDIHVVDPGAPVATAQYQWPNGSAVDFIVDYNSITREVTYTNTGPYGVRVLKYTVPLGVVFTDIFIRTRAATTNSSILINDLVITTPPDPPFAIADTSQAIAGVSGGLDILWIRGANLMANGFTLTGKSTMTWSSPIPSQSRLAYTIKVGDTYPPCVEITKEADPTSASAGTTITYTYSVKNCGRVPITITSIQDTNNVPEVVNLLPDFIAANDGNARLIPGQIVTFQRTRVLQATDPNPLVDTVLINAVDDYQRTCNFDDDAIVNREEPQTVDISGSAIEETVCDGEYDPNDPLLGRVTFTLTDDLGNPITQQYGSTFNFIDLQPGIYRVVISYLPCWHSSVWGQKISNDELRILAQTPGQVYAENKFLLCPNKPCIDITKSVNPPLAAVGQTVTYTYTVSNCGLCPLSNVRVVDDIFGSLTPLFIAANGGSSTLLSGATVEFYLDYTIKVDDPTPLENVAFAIGTDPLGNDVSSSTNADLKSGITISGRKINDLNGNGKIDPGEPPLITNFTLTDAGGMPRTYLEKKSNPNLAQLFHSPCYH